jgi:hypothetical protein
LILKQNIPGTKIVFLEEGQKAGEVKEGYLIFLGNT